jgi:hypothetical protein
LWEKKLNKLVSAAAFFACISIPNLAFGEPQERTLAGTYVLNETTFCDSGSSAQYIGTDNFDPETGMMKEHLFYVTQGIKNGKVNYRYQKDSFTAVPYTLSKDDLRIASHKIPIRIEFGALTNGVASYATFLDFSQSTKHLVACRSMGTWVRK